VIKNLTDLSHWLANRTSQILHENFWFILLALIMIFFFLINFGYGRFYAFTDISNIELHPWQEFIKRFSMWQEYRGYGLELGTEAGYAVPLLFFSFLSTIGFSALQLNFTNNFLLFILPSLAVSVLAYSIFYRDSRRNLIAFFAGLLFSTSFLFYIRILSPLFLQVWPWITSALITAAVLLLLQTGKKRYWLVLLLLYYLNLGAFIGLPSALAPLVFGGLYILYYVLVESRNKRKDFLKILLASLLFVLVSLPMIWSNFHVVFSDVFQVAALAKTYTLSVFTLNLQNRDFSSLFYGFRLIGTGNWNSIIQMPGFVGRLGYPYYSLFTYNPLFLLSSFMLPLVAFAALLFRESKLLRRRLLFLASVSVLLLFLMKGVREPFGGFFLWLMTHVSEFAIFRTPYDKIAPALAFSFSICGAYTFSRILPSLKTISVNKISLSKSLRSLSSSRILLSLRKKSVLKKVVAVLLLIALIVDAYPAYSGQILVPIGFFNVPPYYQQLADYVKSDPASYKILGLPAVEYTNRYAWGYFGITFDGVNLNKPVLERLNTGSDFYGDRIVNAIQNAVQFRSDIPMTPVLGTQIFADNTTPNATINRDGVLYFDYLLQKSNVGQLILRHDMAGGYAYQITDNDWQRYNDLFNSLNSSGLVSDARTYGNVTIYNVNNYMPLIYANLPEHVFTTNSYDSFLGTSFVESRLSLLASLNNYKTFYDYVSNGSVSSSAIISDFKSIYVPIIADQYLAEIQNNLGLEQSNVIPDKSAIAQENATIQELRNITTSDRASTYYLDNIQNSGLFDIYLKLSETEVPKNFTIMNTPIYKLNNGGWEVKFGFGNYIYASSDQLLSDKRLDANFRQDIANVINPYFGKKLVFGNQTVPVNELNSVGNGWYEIGNVNLNAGNLLMHTDLSNSVKLTFPDGIAENELPTNVNVWNTPVSRLENGTWIVRAYKNFTYSSLDQLLADYILDSNFRHDIAKALKVTIGTTDLSIALVSANNLENNSSAPPLVFRQIQAGKLLVSVENASGPFFLNFLESYQSGWKLYVVPTNTLGDAPPVRNFEGSIELAQGYTPFPDSYDFKTLQGTSIHEHLLLNGYSNSWYVNLSDLASKNMITQDDNGNYSFTLLLYFEPQTNFVLSIGVSIIAGIVVCVLVCIPIVRILVRRKRAKH
jgi:hypothetical protein